MFLRSFHAAAKKADSSFFLSPAERTAFVEFIGETGESLARMLEVQADNADEPP